MRQRLSDLYQDRLTLLVYVPRVVTQIAPRKLPCEHHTQHDYYTLPFLGRSKAADESSDIDGSISGILYPGRDSSSLKEQGESIAR